MKTAFVRRSVVKFMPGERIEDAIEAAQALKPQGITTILTRLGENLTRIEEAEEVRDHYMQVHRPGQGGRARRADLGQADAARLRPEPGPLLRLLHRSCSTRCEATGNVLLARHGELAVRRRHDRALQAAARSSRRRSASRSRRTCSAPRRTSKSWCRSARAIRLVKGAYLEPPSVAYPQEVRRRRELLQARLAAAAGRQHPARRAPPHRHARHPAAGAAAAGHRRAEGLEGSLRVRDAVRHPDRHASRSSAAPASAPAA